MTAMPINFVRFGEGAPVPPGVYVHVGELHCWLIEIGAQEVADALEAVGLAPATERYEVASWEATSGAATGQETSE